MNNIWPMYKMCSLFTRNEIKWQKEWLRLKIVLSGEAVKDADIERARISKTAKSEDTGRAREKLINDFIYQNRPDLHLKNDANFHLHKIEEDDDNTAETNIIIENCLDEKYGFLVEDKKNSEILHLTVKGREFATIFGLAKEYIRAIRPLWTTIAFIVSTVLAYYLGTLHQ